MAGKNIPTRYEGLMRFCAKSGEYGFIHHTADSGACQLFCHVSEFRRGQHLRGGLLVNYQLGFDQRNRIHAAKCYVVEMQTATQQRQLQQLLDELLQTKPSPPTV